jgi:hypothetical protein
MEAIMPEIKYMEHIYCGEVFEQTEEKVLTKQEHLTVCEGRGPWKHNLTEEEAF